MLITITTSFLLSVLHAIEDMAMDDAGTQRRPEIGAGERKGDRSAGQLSQSGEHAFRVISAEGGRQMLSTHRSYCLLLIRVKCM